MNIVSRALRKARRESLEFIRLRRLSKAGYLYAPPNYLFLAPKVVNPAVIDIGCGFEAEFAVMWKTKYKADALVVDPTRKHKLHLERLVERHQPKLKYLPRAVSNREGKTEFFESASHESGSLFLDHVNVKDQNTISYEVQNTTINSLIEGLGRDQVEMIKVDIEGAEFDLFDSFDFLSLRKVRQLFVEFHHSQIGSRSFSDTSRIISKFRQNGFEASSLDDANYLFVNNGLV